jgi:hypothetical protein
MVVSLSKRGVVRAVLLVSYSGSGESFSGSVKPRFRIRGVLLRIRKTPVQDPESPSPDP